MFSINVRTPWGASLLFFYVLLLFSNCRGGRVLGIEEKAASSSAVSSSSAPSDLSLQPSLVARSPSRSSALQVAVGRPPTAPSPPQRSTAHTTPDYSKISVELRRRIYTEAVLRNELRDLAFGKQAWAQHFGDIGEEPPLPSHIFNILDSRCPFMLEGESIAQRVKDNHVLVLIPATVDGAPFTLNKLGELIKGQFPNNEDGYGHYNSSTRSAFGSAPLAGAPYWLLMTRDVLEGSRHTSYSDQQAMVNRYSNDGYRLPYGLEAATSILAHYVHSGERRERLFGDDPWTYTRCTAAQLPDDRSPLVVGGFEAAGLVVGHYDTAYYDGDGVSCCRKL